VNQSLRGELEEGRKKKQKKNHIAEEEVLYSN
jgi:hypothetical protein